MSGRRGRRRRGSKDHGVRARCGGERHGARGTERVERASGGRSAGHSGVDTRAWQIRRKDTLTSRSSAAASSAPLLSASGAKSSAQIAATTPPSPCKTVVFPVAACSINCTQRIERGPREATADCAMPTTRRGGAIPQATPRLSTPRENPNLTASPTAALIGARGSPSVPSACGKQSLNPILCHAQEPHSCPRARSFQKLPIDSPRRPGRR